MDLEILDELVGLCEDRMADPFRKKQKEEEIPEQQDVDELSEDDSMDLMDLYSKED